MIAGSEISSARDVVLTQNALVCTQSLSISLGSATAAAIDLELQVDDGTHHKELHVAPQGASDAQIRDTLRANGVYMFKTYVGAAIDAVFCDIIDESGLRLVGLAATDDLHELQMKRPSHNWSVVVKQTNDDIERANVLLARAGLEAIPKTRVIDTPRRSRKTKKSS